MNQSPLPPGQDWASNVWGSTPRSVWVADVRMGWAVALVVSVMICTLTVDLNSMFPPPPGTKVNPFEANVGSRIFKLALLGFGTAVVLWRIKLAWIMFRWINPFFTTFLILVPVSAAWSISRGDTIARYVSILTMFQLCLAFTLTGWRPRRIQSVVRPMLTVLVVASIAVGLLLPNVSVATGEFTDGGWNGITSQKNQLGQLASFATIFWVHALLFSEKKWPIALIGAGISGVCVLLSKSSTSLLATIFSVGFLMMLFRTPQNLRRYMPYIVAIFATVLVIYAMAVLKIVPGLDIILQPIVAFSGKDLTFSNRSEIWVIIKEHIQLSPWIGTGYGAYWIGPLPQSPSIVFLTRMYFYPAESHNGYMEVTNDLGFLGLITLLGYLIMFVRMSLGLFKHDRPQGVLFLAMFFQQCILNLSGSSWFTVNSGFAFFIMTLATTCLARCHLEHKLKELYGPVYATEARPPG